MQKKSVTKVITNNLSLSVDKTLLSVLDAQTSVSSNKYICSIGFRARCCVYATIKDFGFLGSYLHESEHMREGETYADPNPFTEKITRTGLIDSHSLMSFIYVPLVNPGHFTMYSGVCVFDKFCYVLTKYHYLHQGLFGQK